MRRRGFLSVAGATAIADGPSPAAAEDDGKPVLMHLGCQSGPTDDKRLQFFRRHAVEHVCGYPDGERTESRYTVEDLSRLRERCEKHGVSLDMVPTPFLSSSHIDREKRGAIMLGQSPERDRDIEDVQEMIKNCAKVGIPAMKYNMSILGVLRTGRTPGRGGTTLSTWRLQEAEAEHATNPGGQGYRRDATGNASPIFSTR